LKIRNPKVEGRNPRVERGNFLAAHGNTAFRISGFSTFGLLSGFDLRISDFVMDRF